MTETGLIQLSDISEDPKVAKSIGSNRGRRLDVKPKVIRATHDLDVANAHAVFVGASVLVSADARFWVTTGQL